MNDSFSEWDKHVYHNLYARIAWDGHDYSTGKDKLLLESCIEHKKEYGRDNYCKDVVFLTHPLYMHLTHMNRVNSKQYKEDANKYLDNLLLLLSVDRKDKFSIVMMETIHCYAAATSLFLEQGKVDNVIFTRYDSGKPLDMEELKVFRNNNVYFGGGYNRQCLRSSILKMRDAQFNHPDISYGNLLAVNDLVLNSPCCGHVSLIPKQVSGVGKDEVLSLKALLDHLKVDYPKNSKRYRSIHFLKRFQLNF